MTAKDIFHSTVKTALLKEGWSITNDPLVVQLEGIDLFIDLGAEQVLAAQKDNLLIAVEIKTFLGPSLISISIWHSVSFSITDLHWSCKIPHGFCIWRFL